MWPRCMEINRQADVDEERCGISADLFAPTTDRLYRCGCGTNTIHINAWGELGTCTLQYERRVSLRAHSLPDAIEMLFREIRGIAVPGRITLPHLRGPYLLRQEALGCAMGMWHSRSSHPL